MVEEQSQRPPSPHESHSKSLGHEFSIGADYNLGARSRYSERTTIRYLSYLLQVDPFQLLRLHLRMGQGSRLRCTLPKVHLLPSDGCRSLQSLHTVHSPSAPWTQTFKIDALDQKNRTYRYCILLVCLRILPRLAHTPRLDNENWVRPDLTYNHHATARSNHFVTLGYGNCRSR